MYNRYIPQPDGSYSRRKIQDQSMPPPAPQQEKRPAQEQLRPEPQPAPASPPVFNPGPRFQPRPQNRSACRSRPMSHPVPQPSHQEPRGDSCGKKQETNVLSFLKQLLPKDFDTGDLLILLLLLLMSGDCQEDQNTAILTLVLYLFL